MALKDITNTISTVIKPCYKDESAEKKRFECHTWLKTHFKTCEDETRYVRLEELQTTFIQQTGKSIHITELGKSLKFLFPSSTKRKITDSVTKKRSWVYDRICKNDEASHVMINPTSWKQLQEHIFFKWTISHASSEKISWVTFNHVTVNGLNIQRSFSLCRNGSRRMAIHGKEVAEKVLLLPPFDMSKDVAEGLAKSLEFCEDVRLCSGFQVYVDKCSMNGSGEIIGRCDRWENEGMETLRHRSLSCFLVLQSDSLKQKMCSICANINHNSFHKSLQPKEHVNKSKFKRESYMSEQEKNERLAEEKRKRLKVQKRESRLVEQINKNMQIFDTDDHKDLEEMFGHVQPEKLNPDMQLFYQVQRDNLAKKSGKGYRWHPKIIRLCLSIWSKSPHAYKELQSSGMILLPSGRQLQKYKNSITQNPGLNKEVFELMKQEAEKRKVPPEGLRGGIMFDEMAIQDDIQMQKCDSKMKLVGLVDMGEQDNYLRTIQSGKEDITVATQVLQMTFMGNTGYRFPFCHFPTTETSPASLMFAFWRAVKWLLRIEFDIVYCCLDGSQVNRSFIKMHFRGRSPEEQLIINPHTRKKFIFMMDPEHNFKKIRNNVWKSKEDVHAKRILGSGIPRRFLFWKHFEDAYHWDQSQPTLKLYHKLSPAHFDLTPASLMRNHLAKDVLNTDMYNLMQAWKSTLPDAEKEKLSFVIDFLSKISSLISIFNSSLPITSEVDSRFKTLDDTYYWLCDWEQEAKKSPGTAGERNRMTLSDKTIFDIKSMIMGFKQICIETFKESRSIKIFPWRINTNLVENIFCQQRGLHGQNDNPRYIDYTSSMNTILLGCRTMTKKSNTGDIEELPFYRPKKLKR